MKITQQRDSFFNALYDLAISDKNVYLVSADMSAPSLDKFRKDLASQYINVGIAEQNAIDVSVGLSLEGKKVFTYGIASFISLRCLEQIRISCALMHIPITIVSVGVGLGYEDSGPTHHMFEDISILRTFPNIIINNITDSIMASKIVSLSYLYKDANYVRLDRSTKNDLYDKDSNFNKGYNIFKKGENYILSTGIMTRQALNISEKIENLGVIDIHTFPFDLDVIDNIKNSKKIITMEEHILDGGFGSMVCEILNDKNIKLQLLRIGIKKSDGYCYLYGGRENVIWKYYKIDEESSLNKIKEFLGE